jgi:hypothetical protein
MSQVLSVRLPDEVANRLREHAVATSEPASGIAQRLVDEGLRMEAHPGIVFRPGPSGRRAALVRGPDVWEVIGLIRSLDARSEDAVSEAAEWLGLTVAQVRTALAYYGEFPDDIEREIDANEAAAARAERAWQNQQRLLE